jgi:hypothetical protein
LMGVMPCFQHIADGLCDIGPTRLYGVLRKSLRNLCNFDGGI